MTTVSAGAVATSPWRGRWVWPVLAVVVTIGVAASRLLVTPAFYFADDTQTGTAGQWWHLGEQLLGGHWPMFNPHAWTAGNYLAEGQWGLFNPLIWLFAIGTRLLGDVAVAITIVKILTLGLMALGVYLLARSFAATPAWAAAAGIAAPLGGFTVYMDAPSWTTGLLGSAVLPWVWWGLRRLVDERRGPLAYLIASGILITFGYVFAVIVLVLILFEALVRAAVSRSREGIVTVLAAGIYAALLTVAVYLPGILTAPVTIRGTSSISNGGFLNADLTDMVGASAATMTTSIGAWWGAATSAPLVYVLWSLPALALWRCSRAHLRTLIPLALVGAALLVIVTGPDQIGPIRWPVRFMPYLVIVVVVGFVAIASAARRAGSPRRALLLSLAILVGATWVTTVNTTWEWRQAAVAFAVQVIGIVVIWLLVYRSRGARASTWSAMVTAGIAVLLVAPQLHWFPSTPLPQLGGVADAEAARDVPGDYPDDGIVVGNIYAGWTAPATYDERLVANQWYFSNTKVSSLYTVLPFRTYAEDLCADLRGSTCAAALTTLLSKDQATGEQVATLLGVNTIIAIKSSFRAGLPELPAGWRVAETGTDTWVIERDVPVPAAGGVAWTSEGTAVTVQRQDDTGVTLRVDALGAHPTAVLSRLAWPGYTISGAVQSESVRQYLLTLDLGTAEVGDTVTVEFRPPGWSIEVASLVIAVVVLVAWPVLTVVRRRRRDDESKDAYGLE